MNFVEQIKLESGKNFVRIKVIPNSSKTEFVELLIDGTLKIKVKGVPEKGKVNKELINYISKELSISTNNISIISGNTSQNKLIRIDLS